MNADKPTNENDEFDIADAELKIPETALILLARGAKIKNIAAQVDRSEKWVRDLKTKAIQYPAYQVSMLPLVVQGYLIQQRPELKDELDEIKPSNDRKSATITTSATELAKFKHWEDLASVASELVDLWEGYQKGHPIGGYYGYIIDDPLMIELPHGMIDCLILHLKSEFSEFENIEKSKDLLNLDTSREVIVKLALVSRRRAFKGTCPICNNL